MARNQDLSGCPATPTSRSPAARAMRCSCCWTLGGSPARPGLPARPGWRSQAMCCSPWEPTRRGRAARCGSRWGARAPRRTWPRSARSSARSLSGPGGRAGEHAASGRGTGPGQVSMRVLAAMSGGVDSAVAAARAAEAGRDVTGVHLALSANPRSYRSGARGCCTLEDARDARRAADVIGIPFYVWDLAERFEADVVQDFVAEYARGNTPNPCLRCNEKIKFAAVLDRAVALGFDAVCTGHHGRLQPESMSAAGLVTAPADKPAGH